MASPGERFGRNTLLLPLREKGGGEVWSARTDDGIVVAIHVASIGRHDAGDARTDFERELGVMKATVHRNLARVLDGGWTRGARFIVSELIDGAPLDELLERARRDGAWPSFGLSAYIVHEVAGALAAVHGQTGCDGEAPAMAHADVAPRNIFLQPSGRVVLAELLGTPSTQEVIKTAGRERTGTVSYLSPEAASMGRVGPPSDLFALGAILWELLTRRSLFERETDLETLEAVRTAEIPSIPPHCPKALGAIAHRCLTRQPARRPTASDVVRVLAQLVETEPAAQPSAAEAFVRGLFAPQSAPSSPRVRTLRFSQPHALSSSSTAVESADSIGARTNEVRSAPEDGAPPSGPAPVGVAESADPFYDPNRDSLRWDGGRFRVLDRLGRGGMGEVYRVHDRELDEIVALKIIPRESGADLRSTERLRREVRLARRIASPHVCRIYDIVDLGDGTRGLTMQFVEGMTLADRMRGGLPVDYARFARWGAEVADGLGAAHELSIIHRDLKPENVMIDRADHAVILDFGIALSSEPRNETMKLTQDGMIMGTPLYMSPEQLVGLPLDGRSDLFALGLMLAELITGEVPMRGATYAELLERRVTKPEAYRLSEIDPAVPAALGEAIDALLVARVEERLESATSAGERLRRSTPADSVRGASGSSARGSSVRDASERSGDTPLALPRTTGHGDMIRTTAARIDRAPLALASGVLVAGIVSLLFLWGTGDRVGDRAGSAAISSTSDADGGSRASAGHVSALPTATVAATTNAQRNSPVESGRGDAGERDARSRRSERVAPPEEM